MMEKFYSVLIALSTVACVAALCTAGAYSCAQLNTRYYEGMRACLDQGGSWVPQGTQGGYSSSCINPHSQPAR